MTYQIKENFGLYQVFTKFSPLQNVSRENVLKKISDAQLSRRILKLVLSVKLKAMELPIISVVYCRRQIERASFRYVQYFGIVPRIFCVVVSVIKGVKSVFYQRSKGVVPVIFKTGTSVFRSVKQGLHVMGERAFLSGQGFLLIWPDLFAPEAARLTYQTGESFGDNRDGDSLKDNSRRARTTLGWFMSISGRDILPTKNKKTASLILKSNLQFSGGTIGNQLEELRYNSRQSQIYSDDSCFR